MELKNNEVDHNHKKEKHSWLLKEVNFDIRFSIIKYYFERPVVV